jgi:hypothetical protein
MGGRLRRRRAETGRPVRMAVPAAEMELEAAGRAAPGVVGKRAVKAGLAAAVDAARPASATGEAGLAAGESKVRDADAVRAVPAVRARALRPPEVETTKAFVVFL